MNQCHTNRGHIINDSNIKIFTSLRNLQKSGVIKSVDQAMDFAKQQFGQIDDLFKRQIEQVFKVKPKKIFLLVAVVLLQLKMLQRNRNQGSWIK
jgi:hypothetical protein